MTYEQTLRCSKCRKHVGVTFYATQLMESQQQEKALARRNHGEWLHGHQEEALRPLAAAAPALPAMDMHDAEDRRMEVDPDIRHVPGARQRRRRRAPAAAAGGAAPGQVDKFPPLVPPHWCADFTLLDCRRNMLELERELKADNINPFTGDADRVERLKDIGAKIDRLTDLAKMCWYTHSRAFTADEVAIGLRRECTHAGCLPVPHPPAWASLARSGDAAAPGDDQLLDVAGALQGRVAAAPVHGARSERPQGHVHQPLAVALLRHPQAAGPDEDQVASPPSPRPKTDWNDRMNEVRRKSNDFFCVVLLRRKAITDALKLPPVRPPAPLPAYANPVDAYLAECYAASAGAVRISDGPRLAMAGADLLAARRSPARVLAPGEPSPVMDALAVGRRRGRLHVRDEKGKRDKEVRNLAEKSLSNARKCTQSVALNAEVLRQSVKLSHERGLRTDTILATTASLVTGLAKVCLGLGPVPAAGQLVAGGRRSSPPPRCRRRTRRAPPTRLCRCSWTACHRRRACRCRVRRRTRPACPCSRKAFRSAWRRRPRRLVSCRSGARRRRHRRRGAAPPASRLRPRGRGGWMWRRTRARRRTWTRTWSTTWTTSTCSCTRRSRWTTRWRTGTTPPKCRSCGRRPRAPPPRRPWPAKRPPRVGPSWCTRRTQSSSRSWSRRRRPT